jgi:hypothetical protein
MLLVEEEARTSLREQKKKVARRRPDPKRYIVHQWPI